MLPREGKKLAHLVGVKTAEIVAFQDGFDTISVALPEGNCGHIVDRCFDQNVAHLVQRQVSLMFEQKRRGNAATAVPMPRRNVRRGRAFFVTIIVLSSFETVYC